MVTLSRGTTRVSRHYWPSVREAKTFPLPADPEATKEAKDDEGWVHTGDVAAVDESGRFQIIDRVKVSI